MLSREPGRKAALDRPAALSVPWCRAALQYGLNEGTGLAAFVVVVSSRPLPAYRQWRQQLGKSPWGHHDAPPNVVWFDDGAFVETLDSERANQANAARARKRPARRPSPA